MTEPQAQHHSSHIERVGAHRGTVPSIKLPQSKHPWQWVVDHFAQSDKFDMAQVTSREELPYADNPYYYAAAPLFLANLQSTHPELLAKIQYSVKAGIEHNDLGIAFRDLVSALQRPTYYDMKDTLCHSMAMLSNKGVGISSGETVPVAVANTEGDIVSRGWKGLLSVSSTQHQRCAQWESTLRGAVDFLSMLETNQLPEVAPSLESVQNRFSGKSDQGRY